MKFAHSDSSSNSRGSAMLEFAITIPVLFALLLGVVSTGNELANLIFINQVAYNSVLKGSQLDDASRVTGMRNRAKALLAIGTHKIEENFLRTANSPGFSSSGPTEVSQDRIVGVEIDAPLKNLGFLTNTQPQITQTINAPLLTARTIVPTDMTTFENPIYIKPWNELDGNEDENPPPTDPPTDNDRQH